MAKKKKRPGMVYRPPVASVNVWEKAERLLEGLRSDEEGTRLRQRAERATRDAALQTAAARQAADARDLDAAIPFARRAAELAPGEPRLHYLLGWLYAGLQMPIHSARAFRRYLEAEPEGRNELIDTVFADEEHMVSDIAATQGLSREQAEEAGYWLHEGWAAGRRAATEEMLDAAERALAVAPRMVPAMNNQAEALAAQGRLDEALAVLHRVIDEIDPENTFTLASLVRFSLYAGRRDEAQAYVAKLRSIEPEDDKEASEIAHGLTWVDDDEGIYRLLHGRKHLDSLHRRFLAIAAGNLGKRDEARREWEAVRREPGYQTYAGRALERLRAGETQREPYHPPPELISAEDVERLGNLRERQEKGDRRAERELGRLLDQHPEWVLAGEISLRLPGVEEMGARLLELIGTSAALQALRRFVTGKEGSESARMQAGYSLVRLGELKPSDEVPFWRDGEFERVSFRQMEIVDEPVPLPAGAASAARRPIELMGEGRYQEALPLLQALVARFPDIPSFWNDLGSTYHALGRRDEAIAARKRALETDPADIRARLSLANYALVDGDDERVDELARSLADVTRFRPMEFAIYMGLLAQIALRDDDIDAARAHIENARRLGLEHPALDEIEGNINRREGLLQTGANLQEFVESSRRRARRKHEKGRASLDTRDPTLEEALRPLAKEQLARIHQYASISGVSALKKDEMREAIAARLAEPWVLRRATLFLDAEDRDALQWLLDAGGSLPLAEFARRYEVDPEAPPNYYHPDNVLDRLRVHGLATETAPGGEPFVAIPVDLREPLRNRLAQMSEEDVP